LSRYSDLFDGAFVEEDFHVRDPGCDCNMRV
jgi:hypothetical protein